MAFRILRVSRLDEASLCLLGVTPDGSSPLDLKLVGTDLESAFVATIKHGQLDSLRASNYKGSTSEWEAVLSRTLLHTPIPDEHAPALEGLSLVSSVTEESELNIVWRRSKRGTTHELGSLTLKQTDEEEVPLDEWTARAVELLDLAEAENEQLKKNVHGLKQTISNLHDQLQGLTEAKLQHDNSLLHNFSEILNSKKLKIRDQQRLLAGAKVDPSAVALQVRDSRSPNTRPRRGDTARAPKRKANGRDQAETDSDSESDAFEDLPMKDLEEDQVTPEKSDQDTEDEIAPPPPPKPTVRRAIGGKAKKAASKSKAVEKVKTPEPELEPEPEPALDTELPPRRELPFAQKKKGPAPKLTPAAVDDESETDDEL